MAIPSRNQWTGKKVEQPILWVDITDMLLCFSRCIVFIVSTALCSCFSCGVCYDRHFISPVRVCPLSALAVRSTPIKMNPFTPKWDKSTSAIIVHWGEVGALWCFYLLPWATMSAAVATSSILQWHWPKKKLCTPELSCSEPRYRCELIYTSPNWQVCTCEKEGEKIVKMKLSSYHFAPVSGLLEQWCLFAQGHYVKCGETVSRRKTVG